MQRIKQRDDYECGLAALAMVLGMEIEKAEALIPFKCHAPAPDAEPQAAPARPPSRRRIRCLSRP